MSESKELERLQNRRAELEEESRALEEQQKNLEETTKKLEEKIAIEALENNNKTMRESITKLESKVNELEQKLRETPEEKASFKLADEMRSEAAEAPKPTEEMTPNATEAIEEEPDGEVVEVTALEDPTIAEQEEFAENFKRPNEKKKRKFF